MSSGEPTFVDLTAFEEIVPEVPTEGGESYQDLGMSGPTVVWLANTPPEKIRETFDHFGWQGGSGARALHNSARQWLAEYHPELLDG